MSSAAEQFEAGAVVLGYVGTVAAWRRPAPGQAPSRYVYPMLIISTCATSDEGVHEPAASITINNREGLIALRSAIDEALKDPA